MNKRDEIVIIVEIAKRAEEMGLLMFDKMSLIMDLQNTHDEFNLRLTDLLNADSSNFLHDIAGIQNNFNRQTMEMENCFLPRYSSPEEVK